MKLIFTKHALIRMAERGIDVDEVREVIVGGRLLREYPDDRPWPSYLKAGISARGPLHAIYSLSGAEAEMTGFVITVFRPEVETSGSAGNAKEGKS